MTFKNLMLPSLMVLSFSCVQREFNIDSDLEVWQVTRKSWDNAAELEFSKWVQTLGEARAAGKCRRLGDCLMNPVANTLYQPNDALMDIYADCADLPLIMRAYFAYRKSLPFIFTSAVQGGRYTSGNKPIAWRNQSSITTLRTLFRTVSNQVSSAAYRMAPELEGTDTYPISISRESVRPGTVYYDPNGHVLMVYKVEPNGTVKFIDGHPDNSLTVQTFGESHVRGSRNTGGGFRNFRRYTENYPNQTSRGTNAVQPHFNGDEQYQSTFILNGQNLNYYSWVKEKLRDPNLQNNPVAEFEEKLNQLCVDVKERVISVNKAVEGGIIGKEHPGTPANIHQADGDWGVYSTPGRDSRLKLSLRTLYRDASLLTTSDRAKALQVFRTINNSCLVQYRKSNATVSVLKISDIVSRVYDLSFDPYHCVEMRWGAFPARGGRQAHNDYATCPRNSRKEELYWSQAKLRNSVDRAQPPHNLPESGTQNQEKLDFISQLGVL